MATYKVIQDIEAEDKLVGPLSLRQFIYAAIAALCAYLSFIALTKGASFLIIIFGPLMLFTGFFAAPWGGDQPTEVWALAKIRFFIKPRRRIWDQSGVKDLVNVTAPKKIDKAFSNGLSQSEVHSRLRALASTIDSRGWVIKNVNANLFDPTRSQLLADSDRLINPNSLPQEVSNIDVTASDDMLDETNNSVAQNLDRMVHEAYNTRHQQLINEIDQHTDTKISQPTNPQLPPPADYWFLNQPVSMPNSASVNRSQPTSNLVIPGSGEYTDLPISSFSASEEKALAKKLIANRKHLEEINFQHMKVIQPIGATTPITTPPVTVTPSPDPAKISLAARNDLNISTIGRIVNKQDEQSDEVVISLHDHSS